MDERVEKLVVNENWTPGRWSRFAWIATLNSHTNKIDKGERCDDVGVNKFGKLLLSEYDTQEKVLQFISGNPTEYSGGSFANEYELRREFDKEFEMFDMETDTLYYFRDGEWYVLIGRCRDFIPLQKVQEPTSDFIIRNEEGEVIGRGNNYEIACGLAMRRCGTVKLEADSEVISGSYTYYTDDGVIEIRDKKLEQDVKDEFDIYHYVNKILGVKS